MSTRTVEVNVTPGREMGPGGVGVTSPLQPFDIPEPDIDLEVGSGSHAQQTADIMKRFEPVLDENPPAAVLVVGDVNSTIACATDASISAIVAVPASVSSIVTSPTLTPVGVTGLNPVLNGWLPTLVSVRTTSGLSYLSA